MAHEDLRATAPAPGRGKEGSRRQGTETGARETILTSSGTGGRRKRERKEKESKKRSIVPVPFSV